MPLPLHPGAKVLWHSQDYDYPVVLILRAYDPATRTRYWLVRGEDGSVTGVPEDQLDPLPPRRIKP